MQRLFQRRSFTRSPSHESSPLLASSRLGTCDRYSHKDYEELHGKKEEVSYASREEFLDSALKLHAIIYSRPTPVETADTEASISEGVINVGRHFGALMKSFKTMLRVEKQKLREDAPSDENEIIVLKSGNMPSYINQAMIQFQENGAGKIIFKAMGESMDKTVMTVELIKRRIAGLYQTTSIESIDISEMWEPLEEIDGPSQFIWHFPVITMTLSKQKPNTSYPGYQPPLPVDQVLLPTEYEYEGQKHFGKNKKWQPVLSYWNGADLQRCAYVQQYSNVKAVGNLYAEGRFKGASWGQLRLKDHRSSR